MVYYFDRDSFGVGWWTRRGIADTTEAALERAQNYLPPNVILRYDEQQTSVQKVVTVKAFDEEGIREQIERDIGPVKIKGITLKELGKKGFLGIGKKPNCYEVQVEQFIHEIKYTDKLAKIRLNIVEGVSPELWAQKLKDKKDYRALAAVFRSQDYSDEFQKFEKEKLANDILREAGSEAAKAIREELATDGVGSWELAELSIKIDDLEAIPILKKLLDRDAFAGYGDDRVTEFLRKHPDVKVRTEMVKCAICGKKRPITEMRGCGEEPRQLVCPGTCWEKQASICGSEDGVGCPYYTENRICAPPQGNPSPCNFTFKVGSTYRECPVYRTYPRI